MSHGSRELSSVLVDTYNIELRDGQGFLGDRANKRVFKAILENRRNRLRRNDGDPLDSRSTEDVYKDKHGLVRILMSGDPEAAGVLIGSLEEFAHELAAVVERLLEAPEWRGTQCISIGGGFREGRFGELVIGRTAVILKADGVATSLVPLRHAPEEAGLIGGIHLAPKAILTEFTGILAVDIGGTNLRTGIVEPHVGEDGDISGAGVWAYELWRHADGKPTKEDMLDHMIERLRNAVARAEHEEFSLAPFVAVACPGLIGEDGSIVRGGQNLPGNWEGVDLAGYVSANLPKIRGRDTMVSIHNDAVVQGLSELPYMRDLAHWGVLTIGTGLGNARFTTRQI